MRSEFAFINRIRERTRGNQIGDDTAVIEAEAGLETLVTADLLVEDIHFVRRWTPPAWLGHKSLAVSLSDIAAMGGRPQNALITLASPPTAGDQFWEEFFDGYLELAARHGVRLVGGDTSAAIDRITIDSIVLGVCEKGAAVRRDGAKVGDLIVVSGDLGKSALGLELLRQGGSEEDFAVRAHLRPEPRVALGQALGERRLAHAMIDISDGLAQDLAHICEESAVSAVLEAEAVPLSAGLELIAGDVSILEIGLSSGEEYELLFTAPKKTMSDLEALGDSLGIILTPIGEVIPKGDYPLHLSRGGHLEAVATKGYDHFAPKPGT